MASQHIWLSVSAVAARLQLKVLALILVFFGAATITPATAAYPIGCCAMPSDSIGACLEYDLVWCDGAVQPPCGYWIYITYSGGYHILYDIYPICDGYDEEACKQRADEIKENDPNTLAGAYGCEEAVPYETCEGSYSTSYSLSCDWPCDTGGQVSNAPTPFVITSLECDCESWPDACPD